LCAQKAIALLARYHDVADARKALYQTAPDETSDRRDTKTEVVGRFWKLEGAALSKWNSVRSSIPKR